MRVGVIGAGAIGGYILDGIARGAAGPVTLVGVADLPSSGGRLVECGARVGCPTTTEVAELIGWRPDLIVEAAAPAAVRAHALAILRGGIDLLVMSVGALANGAFLAAVADAARASGQRVHVPSGAIGGLDVLRSARIAGLDAVTLTTSKPPRALAGAPFFDANAIDLAGIDRRTVLFEGSAAVAVEQFPANVNVAAAVSLAGIGPESTRVRVVADPALTANVHEIAARGAFGEMTLRVANLPSPTNPKTSLLACLSPLATLRRLTDPIQVG